MDDGEQRAWGDPARRRTAGTHPATFLIREIGNLGRQLDRAMSDHLTVNATDLRAMSVLLGRGPMAPSELAAALGLGAPATSMAIDRLERVGHVTRERDDADRRRVTVRPTPESATKARDALMPMIREVDALLDDVPEADRAAIQHYLQQVAQTMRRHLETLSPEPPS